VLLALALGAASATAQPIDAGAKPAAEPSKAPKVTKQPTNATVNEGQSASFSAAASGTPTPTVQWERSTNEGVSWSPIVGATANTFTVTSSATSENSYAFRAAYTNVAGKTTTLAVTLTVEKPPVVIQQPVGITVEEGQSASFEASASGSPPPTIKWETSSNAGQSWTPVSGTQNKLTIPGTTSSLSGHLYRAAFKNLAGETFSEAATLTVQKPPAVTEQPISTTVNEGQSASFEASASGFPAPGVQWEVSTDSGGSWSPIEGATSSLLTIANTVISEDGRRYRAVFTNSAGSVTSSAATLTVHAAPVITQQPLSTTVVLGESAGFDTAASGFPTPTLQWEVSTDGGSSWNPIAGATSGHLTIASPTSAESGRRYRAVFTNISGTTTTNSATLTVTTSRFSAVAWGSNSFRQLGDGFKEPFSAMPVPVSGLQFVTAVSAGGRHSLALLADGTVAAWGANGSGQLGNGSTAESSVPVPVSGLSEVTAISAGSNHSLALLANGTVMAWGNNEGGQLGVGGGFAEGSNVPIAVNGLTGVTAIAAGANFSLALLSNGTAVAWGENESGQLGSGGGGSDSPVPIKKLTGATAIAAGAEFSLALLGNGTVQAWGDNGRGELGNVNVEEGSRTPVAVEGLTGVTAIAAGAHHALALLGGGSVMAWGEDADGELGNGVEKSFEPSPVAVGGLSGVVAAISAGTQDSAALLGSGSVMTWGSNASGVLGAGSTAGSSAVPLAVVGLSKVTSVSAGRSQMLAFGERLPIVTSVSPKFGSSTGGTTVTITGSTLAAATSVKFGASQASGFTVNSDSSITATAPAGVGTVDVTVTTPSGTSPISPADRFTFLKVPTVTKLSLKSGSVSGGATVSITGSELTAASSVSFGQTSTTEFTVNSPTSITVVVPAVTTAGKVDISVTNVAGASATTAKDRFTYAPAVLHLAPASGPPAGGTSVTVTGAGFALGNATTIKFGRAKSKAVNCTSSTTCVATAPAQAAGKVDVIATVAKAKSAVNPTADSYTYG
jgi:alpha-tubulin suppressor-like RCC1 family protein